MTKELIDLQKNPPEGIKVIMNEKDVTDIHATIEGPGNFSLTLYKMMMTSSLMLKSAVELSLQLSETENALLGLG